MNLKAIQRRVQGVIGSSIDYFPSIGSTSDYLLKHDELPDGYTVVTDLQTAGRGRGDHRWDARSGENLLFSFLLLLDTRSAKLSQLPILTSLAVCEAVAASGVSGVGTKWPNDVVYNDRKLCGILTESRIREGMARTVVGIGVNVNQRLFPESIGDRATSLALLSGRDRDREQLLGLLLDRLNQRIVHTDWSEAIGHYRELCTTLGRSVAFDFEGRRRSGFASDIGDDGRLLIDDGEVLRAYSGSEVEHLRSS